MAIYGSKLTFKAPTRAEVALTDELVEVINSHHRKLREHLFHLCMIAYGLRRHNLVQSKSGAGGNANDQKYKPEFWIWYTSHGLKNVYGSEGNFTLYAMAGRLLEYVRWQVGAEYISQLPTSMTTLYALSQIVWKQGDSTDKPRRELFAKALLEPIRDGSTANALIHPAVTRKEVDKWRKKHTGEGVATSDDDEIPEVPTNHTITVVTIKAHEDLLKFARSSGRKVTGPKIEDVERLINELNELLAAMNQGKDRFVAESHLESVKEAYEEAKNPNFGAAILAAEGNRKKTKKG